MEFRFIEETHEYFLGDKKIPSVSEVLTFHKIAPEYTEVDSQILERARIFGNNRHLEMEEYFKGYRTKEQLSEIALEGINLIEEHFIPISSEVRMHYKGLIAGTTDMLALNKETDKYNLIDYKFTYSFNENHVMRQLNLYRFIAYYFLGVDVEGLYCLWYNKKEKEFELKIIATLNHKKNEELIDLYYRKIVYTLQAQDLIKRQQYSQLWKEKMSQIKEAQNLIKDLERDLDLYKMDILEEMERYNIRFLDLDGYKITYVQGTQKRGAHLKVRRIKKGE